MATFAIKRLRSGGIITNYFCTSACRHCLYNCSPRWNRDYLAPDLADDLFGRVRSLGCRSVHIGGGEPLLRPQKLGKILACAQRADVRIEYVETNSAWFQDADGARTLLASLQAQGLKTLLVSISPFHNEFIPLARVKGVMAACRRTEINVFPWIMDFYEDINRLDSDQTSPLEVFEACYGTNYLKRIRERYWIHMGGRALDTFRPVLPSRPLKQILASTLRGCADELSDTTHFHLDLFGNYIPGLCAGLAIAKDDLGRPLSSERYPLLTTLAFGGIKGLYDLAHQSFDYAPSRSGYINKCDLCTEIRTFIVQRHPDRFIELRPEGFYGRHSSSGFATSSGSR